MAVLLQLTVAGLAGVMPRDLMNALLREFDQVCINSVLLDLPRDEAFDGDVDLLL
jgi:hypothetical protein